MALSVKKDFKTIEFIALYGDKISIFYHLIIGVIDLSKSGYRKTEEHRCNLIVEKTHYPTELSESYESVVEKINAFEETQKRGD